MELDLLFEIKTRSCLVSKSKKFVLARFTFNQSVVDNSNPITIMKSSFSVISKITIEK